VKELGNLVSARFGKTITNRRDCEELSEQIQVVTSHLLSYNTIRRYFGIVKGQFKTRRQTLDILSQYCGYNDFTDFSINYSLENNCLIKNQFYFELIAIEKESIVNLLKKSWNTNKEIFTYQIIEVNRECLRRKKIYLFLSIINELKFQIENLTYSDQLQVAQGTLIYLRGIELTRSECVSLANNLNFQKNIISNFVDIQYLKEGYYAELVNSAIHFADSQTQQFFLCIKILHNILNNIFLNDLELPILDESQHPILKGRIIGVLYWAKKNNLNGAESVNLKRLIKTHYHYSLFLEISTLGILCDDMELLEELICYEIGVFTLDYQLMHNQLFYLSKCLVYMTHKNKKLTYKSYVKINPKNVSVSHRFLFDQHLPVIEEYLNM